MGSSRKKWNLSPIGLRNQKWDKNTTYMWVCDHVPCHIYVQSIWWRYDAIFSLMVWDAHNMRHFSANFFISMWVDMPCKKSPISVYIGTYLAYWHISHISHISCISSHICAYQHCIGLYLMSYYCCSILSPYCPMFRMFRICQNMSKSQRYSPQYAQYLYNIYTICHIV